MKIRSHSRAIRIPLTLLVLAALLGATAAWGATSQPTTTKTKHQKKVRPKHVVKAVRTSHRTTRRRILHRRTLATTTRGVIHATIHKPHLRRYRQQWSEPTFADSTVGDRLDGEDLVVRKAAVDALGPYNGSVVVVDPNTGRILTIVNQKLALSNGFQPCSTVKIVVSLASLSEGIVEPDAPLRLSRRSSIDMTGALAHSNNFYFAHLGQELGFDRVVHYARLFGLGEKAGLDIPGEQPGTLTEEPPKDGVGMMTSFGEGIGLTPLELASIVGTVANGGTMYYLQYPRSQEEVEHFAPKVKRYLDIANLVPEIKPGMEGAVEYGTARRAKFDPDEPVFGKTGTCTGTDKPGVHLGWFGSFNEVGKNKLAVMVLLTGGYGVSGPVASGIGGQVYRRLEEQNYFTTDQASTASPLGLLDIPVYGR